MINLFRDKSNQARRNVGNIREDYQFLQFSICMLMADDYELLNTFTSSGWMGYALAGAGF